MMFLALAGAPGDTTPGGPPQVTKRQLNNELGRLFEVVRLDQFRWLWLLKNSARQGLPCPFPPISRSFPAAWFIGEAKHRLPTASPSWSFSVIVVFRHSSGPFASALSLRIISMCGLLDT